MKWNVELYDKEHQFVSEYGKSLLEFVPVDRTQKVLDIGCGTGTLTHELLQRSGYVLGIDGSKDMIQKAKKQYPEVDFAVLDALKMTDQKEWDVIFSNAVFHWIPNHKLLLSNIYRALKPEGKLVCEFGAHGNIAIIEEGFAKSLQEFGCIYHSGFNFPTVQVFKDVLVQEGFKVEEIYSYDRPTPFKDGEKGMRNWARQFFASHLEPFSETEQEEILKNLEDNVREALWNGEKWVGDYKRLRVIAHRA